MEVLSSHFHILFIVFTQNFASLYNAKLFCIYFVYYTSILEYLNV